MNTCPQIIDISDEELINIWTNQWVMLWCKKYHPETFEKGREFATNHLLEFKNKKKEK